jgi:hypothetical protein
MIILDPIQRSHWTWRALSAMRNMTPLWGSIVQVYQDSRIQLRLPMLANIYYALLAATSFEFMMETR